MIQIQKLDVGPIIGETTPFRTRLWGRALPPSNNNTKLHGVARLLLKKTVHKTVFFKLQKQWDYTGVGIIDDLSPNTTYQYQIGWFAADLDTAHFINNPPALNWDGIVAGTVKSGSDNVSETRSFIVGSCRYNVPWAKDDKNQSDTRGDKTFRAALAQITQRDTHGLMMLGDQIYADFLGLGANSFESFTRLYRGAFKQEHLRALMSKIPTYMMLDDHEIENDWSKKACRDMDKLIAARYAYQAYQASHSPLLPYKNGKLNGIPSKWWYEFSDGCCDVFMMDVRLERIPEKKQMISTEQMNALETFIKKENDKVKIIGTPVPFIEECSDDKWSGYTEQRNQIINCIRENKIRRVVFLSGDIHLSSAAQMTCENDKNFKILSFTCSPFFWPWPLPFWVWPQYKSIKSEGYTYHVEQKTKQYKKENFVRLTFSSNQVRFEVFPRKKLQAEIDETFDL